MIWNFRSSFASGERPSFLQLLQGARMQLRWPGLVWGTGKPSAGRNLLGACATLTARCKKQHHGDAVPASSWGPGSVLGQEPAPIRSASRLHAATWRPSTANIDPAHTAQLRRAGEMKVFGLSAPRYCRWLWCESDPAPICKVPSLQFLSAPCPRSLEPSDQAGTQSPGSCSCLEHILFFLCMVCLRYGTGHGGNVWRSFGPSHVTACSAWCRESRVWILCTESDVRDAKGLVGHPAHPGLVAHCRM